jgi:GNAT superfamily N-acetyltransferase
MSTPGTDVQVRPATSGDREALVALMLAQFREHAIALGAAGVGRAIDGVFEQPQRGRLLLATVAGTAVGFAGLSFTWSYEHGGRAAWLDELYVEPAHRERGIGRRLVHAAYDVARESGALTLDLEVDVEHRRAEHLYEREGFVRLQRARWVRPL